MGGVLRNLARGLGAAALTVLVALAVPPPVRVPIVAVLLGFAAAFAAWLALASSA